MYRLKSDSTAKENSFHSGWQQYEIVPRLEEQPMNRLECHIQAGSTAENAHASAKVSGSFPEYLFR